MKSALDHEVGHPEEITIGPASALTPGSHVLAIQVHNASISSSDLSLIADLRIQTAPVTMLVSHQDRWRYFVGSAEPPGPLAHANLDLSSVATLGTGPSWTDVQFDDSSWNEGRGRLGFGTGNEDTTVNIGSIATSLYLRRSFIVSRENSLSEQPLELTINYDDGFVAYLNGHEVSRRNLGSFGGIVYHEQRAFQTRRATVPETVSLGPASELLNSGVNILAVQVHNRFLDDADLVIEAELRIVGAHGRPLTGTESVWRYVVGTSEPAGGLKDEDGEFSDWIELYNGGDSSVALGGWSLTDDPDRHDKWRFPPVKLGRGQFLVVFASGKNRGATDGTPLHTNFRLSRDGEYLALFDAENSRFAVSELSPAFPRQSPFHSYGKFANRSEYSYLDTPTPGAPNTRGEVFHGITTAPQLSASSGFYDEPFSLSLSVDLPDMVIRYTTDGREPTTSDGILYSAPIRVDRSMAVRARAFQTKMLPSRVVTATFLVEEPPALRSLPALSIVGDPARALYEPHGVLAVVGGYYGNAPNWLCISCWLPEGLDDYNHPIQRGSVKGGVKLDHGGGGKPDHPAAGRSS